MLKSQTIQMIEELGRKNFPSKELDRRRSKLGEIALKDGDLGLALTVFEDLNDREKVRCIAEKCLKKNKIYEAFTAFEFLNDREGMFKAIKNETYDNSLDNCMLDHFTVKYLGEDNIDNTIKAFKKWVSTKKIPNAYHTGNIANHLNIAYNLADKYNIGVGIAKKGLPLTYIFHLFGLGTKIVEVYRRDKEITLCWNNASKKDFEGKKVIVIDNDVVSGKTCEGVLKELEQYYPERIDLVLTVNPLAQGSNGIGIGTIHENIPNGYNKVYYPKNFVLSRNYFIRLI